VVIMGYRWNAWVVTAAALAALTAPGLARAQGPAPWADPYRGNGIYAAPGFYGVMYGTPSYGTVRAYSEFSSPYGAGYAYGYPPARVLPGRYGVGLWRPSLAAPGYVYGASVGNYRTYPVPYIPAGGVYTPPVGVYAPGYGPSYVGW
jgi:hypothetical protein